MRPYELGHKNFKLCCITAERLVAIYLVLMHSHKDAIFYNNQIVKDRGKRASPAAKDRRSCPAGHSLPSTGSPELYRLQVPNQQALDRFRLEAEKNFGGGLRTSDSKWR